MFFPESQIRSVLTYDALIPAIRQALIDSSAGRVDQPARMILRAGNAEGHRNGWFALMPVLHGDMMAVKTVTFYPGNAELGLHTHMATIELLNRATGEPLAVMDGRLITEMRTAAVSAVALSALAPALFPSDAKAPQSAPATLGIFGSGVQARAHIQAFRHVWPALSEIRIWSRTAANAQHLAEEIAASHGIAARAVSAEETAASDVVLTVTSSPAPVLQGRWLAPRSLVLAVGATGSSLRELDDEAMQSSFVVAESRTCAERESGDVIGSGVKVQAEIGEILAPLAAAPASNPVPASGRIVFKSVGMAIEDLTAARLVWHALRP